MERGIGQLKRRFHVLHSEVRISPPVKICKMIHVCGMLHNICKERNIHIPLNEAEAEPDDGVALHDPVHDEAVHPLPAGRRNAGLLYRDAFCNLHFK